MTKLGPGQVAVITGGATGIGYALATGLADKGLSVVLADNDVVGLSKAGESLRAKGATVLCVPTDVADRATIQSLREQVIAAFGRVDIICNNAGIYSGMQPVWHIDLAAWRRLFEINYWGVVFGIQEFIPILIEQGSGHVVNTASMSGLSTVPGSADYGSAKHALIAISETLRADLDLAGHNNIGVTLLCPSVVMTDMGRRALGIFNASDTLDGRKTVGSGPDLAAIIEPEVLAAAAIAGIEAGHMYVTPTPASRDRFLKRIQPILNAFDTYPESRGIL
jgi:NAD(P)-dependent dehydrogenase (short-subunit alcohol dehydrogenase family)